MSTRSKAVHRKKQIRKARMIGDGGHNYGLNGDRDMCASCGTYRDREYLAPRAPGFTLTHCPRLGAWGTWSTLKYARAVAENDKLTPHDLGVEVDFIDGQWVIGPLSITIAKLEWENKRVQRAQERKDRQRARTPQKPHRRPPG